MVIIKRAQHRILLPSLPLSVPSPQRPTARMEIKLTSGTSTDLPTHPSPIALLAPNKPSTQVDAFELTHLSAHCVSTSPLAALLSALTLPCYSSEGSDPPSTASERSRNSTRSRCLPVWTPLPFLAFPTQTASSAPPDSPILTQNQDFICGLRWLPTGLTPSSASEAGEKDASSTSFLSHLSSLFPRPALR